MLFSLGHYVTMSLVWTSHYSLPDVTALTGFAKTRHMAWQPTVHGPQVMGHLTSLDLGSGPSGCRPGLSKTPFCLSLPRGHSFGLSCTPPQRRDEQKRMSAWEAISVWTWQYLLKFSFENQIGEILLGWSCEQYKTPTALRSLLLKTTEPWGFRLEVPVNPAKVLKEECPSWSIHCPWSSFSEKNFTSNALLASVSSTVGQKNSPESAAFPLENGRNVKIDFLLNNVGSRKVITTKPEVNRRTLSA